MKPANHERQQYWRNHIESCQASGLSGAQYCEQTQLTYHCFIYWRRKLSGTVDSTVAAPQVPAMRASSGFIAVRGPVEPPVEQGLVLSLPNGWVVGNIQASTVSLVPDLLAALS